MRTGANSSRAAGDLPAGADTPPPRPAPVRHKVGSMACWRAVLRSVPILRSDTPRRCAVPWQSSLQRARRTRLIAPTGPLRAGRRAR